MKFLEDVRLEFSPHPQAPTFSLESNPGLILEQLAKELASPNCSTNEKILQLFREAGFVSLWFYLKFILGHEGPYNLINDKLHLAMCNFRQRVATTPGIKAAIFVPRSCLKTTICTHGAGTWELLRDSDLRIGMTSSTSDRALAFMQQMTLNITSNKLHSVLYPELKKKNRGSDSILLANRVKQHVEASVVPITAGGSSQGLHVDLFNADDIVGEDLLNSDRSSTADMRRVGNWLHTNLKTLVASWESSRVLVEGTRYDIEDPYETIMAHSREHIGYWDEIEEDYPIDPRGDWVTFYLPALVEEESILPEAFTPESLAELEKTDIWTYSTQYMNNPHASKPGDMANLRVKEIDLDYDVATEEYYIIYDVERIPLKDCDVIMGIDPAGCDGVANRRNSRNAYCVLARDWKDRFFLLTVQRGYWSTVEFLKRVFEEKKKYDMYIRATYFEAQGPFKSWISIIRQEEERRDEYLHLVAINALGDKETTVRNIIQPRMEHRQLHAIRDRCTSFLQEVRIFPSKQMDALDCTKVAIFKSIRPEPPETEDEDEYISKKKRSNRAGVSPVSGY